MTIMLMPGVKYDPKNGEKLDEILAYLEPDIVFTEEHPYDRAKRELKEIGEMDVYRSLFGDEE